MNIKKIIKEEMDDFKWIMDEPINPWVEYNALIIDTKLTDEEINEYIEMAINTVNIGNKDAWIVGRQEDINRIQFYTDEDAAVIYINPNNNHLQYSDLEWFNDNEAWKTEFKNYKIIKTSELKNNLKESTDDLDWIRDEVNTDELTTFKNFFVPGQTYYMKRTLYPKNTEPYVFIDITPDRIYGELFNFIGESFSFNYVTKRLEELGLTLLDLLPDNNPQSI
jgi:hypothetical protein